MDKRFVVIGFVAILLLGCAGNNATNETANKTSNNAAGSKPANNSAGNATSANPEKPAEGTVLERTVPSNSSWKYAVYLPPGYNRSRSYPLIVGLHGTGGSAMDYVNMWKDEAGKNGFMLACPQSPDSQGWDIRIVNEFTAAVADDVKLNYNITNMYLTGHSAGARMIVTVALLNPHFRGVAMVDGALPPWYCPPEIQYCSDEYAGRYGSCGCAEGQYVYMLNGQNDDIVVPSEATDAKNSLEKCGMNVTQRFLPNHGHEYPTEENVNIIGWFKTLEADSSIQPIVCKPA